MKCKNLTIMLLAILFVFVPFVVNAKENCTVVSGTGNDIGSEIACGSEHFYVIDSDDDNIRMLAKYNLDYGQTYSKIYVSDERWNELKNAYGNVMTSGYVNYKNEVLSEPEFEGYYHLQNSYVDEHSFLVYRNVRSSYEKLIFTEERWNELVSTYNIGQGVYDSVSYDFGIYDEPEFADSSIRYIKMSNREIAIEKSNDEPIKQSSKAIGAHGSVLGQPEYPEYGIVRSQYELGLASFNHTENYSGGYNDVIIDEEELNDENNTNYLPSLKGYKNTLSDYNIESIDLMTIKDLDNIVYKLTNNHLPLESWLTGWQVVQGTHGEYNIMGSFKDYLPEGYEWLYGTTYWTKSNLGTDADRYEIFIDTLGNVCNDDFCTVSVGAGVRPVITVAREKVIYNITVESNDNGTVEVVRSSEAGKNVSFILRSREGFKLGSLVLKDDGGNTIEFTEISTDEEGNIIVSTNQFTMPLNNVRIIVNWVSDNQEEPTPDTPTDDPNEGNNTEPMNGEISTDEKVPITGDNILKSLSLLGISILVLSSVILVGKKNNKKKRLVIE